MGTSNNRTGSFARNQEDNIIRKMDRKIDEERTTEALQRGLSDDEKLAFLILAERRAPEGKHTRKWAIKTLSNVIHGRMVNMSAVWTLTTDDLDAVKDLFEYFVPKPKQAVELTGADDGPVKFQREPTYEEMLAAAGIMEAQKNGGLDETE